MVRAHHRTTARGEIPRGTNKIPESAEPEETRPLTMISVKDQILQTAIKAAFKLTRLNKGYETAEERSDAASSGIMN